MKKYRRFIDAALLLAGVAVVILLLQAPPVTTSQVPMDDNHRALVEIALVQGRKAAEKHCEKCHNPDNVPLPEGHPAGYRCLFCHRLPVK